MHARLLLWGALLASAASAQHRGPDLTQAARGADLVAAGYALRWDFETGTLARLRWPEGPALAGTSEAAARLALDALRPFLDPTLVIVDAGALAPLAGPVLVASPAHDLGHGRQRVDFQQRAGAYPVLHAGVSVELAFDGEGWRPVVARVRYLPQIPPLPGADPEVEAALLERFPSYEGLDVAFETTVQRVAVPTPAGVRPAFAVTVFEPPVTSWQVHVDAETGVELGRFEVSCTAVARGQVYAQNPGDTPRALAPLQRLYVNQGAQRVTTDVLGTHPLTGMVSLDDGLAGPLTRVFVSGEDELSYTGPADLTLSPQEAEAAQDELAGYQHLTDFNRHVQATYPRFLGSDAARTRFALAVRYKNNQGQAVRNAFFTPQNTTAGGETFTGLIAMGTFGTREAARSSSVVQHEYCHALFSEIVNLGGDEQANGLNEGLADYLPSAFKEDPLVGGWLVQGAIRDLRDRFVWPQDRNGDVHRVGHIFAGALWRARAAAEALDPDGRLAIDQAVVEGLFRLQNQPDLIDAREAILEGDRVVNGGAYRVTLSDALNEHGIGPAAQNDAPTLAAFATPAPVEVGDTLELTLTLDDPDGDPLRVAWSPLANTDYDEATRTFRFQPNATQIGQHTVTFTVSDEAFSTSESVTLEVVAAPGAQTTLPGASATPGATPRAAAPAPAPRSGGGGGGGGCSLGGESGGAAWALALLGALLLLRRRA
ncbi:MAG: M36 family metallopeptidase [Planctomycetota bacterium]